MRPRDIIIFSLFLTSILLIGGGIYIAADNLSTPKGYLFEGIVLAALGAILLVIMTALSYLVRTHELFTNIYGKQLEMQQEMTAFYTRTLMAQRPAGGLSSLLGAMGGPRNMETGETTSSPIDGQDSIQKINDVISSFLGAGKKPFSQRRLEDMSVEQLENELSKAVKADKFELANIIKDLIHKKKNPDSQSPDNQTEE